jgi:SAM-dependent methyltransferase
VWLKRRWNDICAATIGGDEFWRLSIDHRIAHRALSPLISRHVRGVVLDLGAGRMAWRALLSSKADQYVSTDAFDTHPDIDFVADVQGGLPVPDSSFDSIFCCSVLEHVQRPWDAFPEFYRVLKPGGTLVLSVPFLYYLHGQPSDYYRFTRYGVEHLARISGFEVVEISVAGGLAHSALHAVSMLTTSLLYHPSFPHLSRAVTWVLGGLAKLVDSGDRGGLFAQSVNAALRRPGGDALVASAG